MRKTTGQIIWGTHPKFGHAFEYVMIGLILLSMVGIIVASIPGIPPAIMAACGILEFVIIITFSIEYVFRIWTSEKPFRYILSFWGFIDLLAILPFWLALGSGWEASRTLRILRILRLLKLARYMTASDRLKIAFELVWRELLLAFFLANVVILVAAVGIYNFENEAQPEAFASIPHALWFAVATLTTVGYGDMTPVTAGGKFFTFLILMIGIAIVAIPTSLITAALTQAKIVHKERSDNRNTENRKQND